jgi:presequence protease
MNLLNANLKINQVVDRQDIDSIVKHYIHKNGGSIVRIKNNDLEKFFSVAFRTSVDNSTGVPHILEHSVLSGSENYPISDPFNSLNKSTPTLYLNASTYPDKTLYQVSSDNYTAFKILTNVYLDACFKPLLTKDTFEREGIRYEIHNDQLSYAGIVYNEMKGDFSDTESYVTSDGLLKYVYPDNQYQHCSGGNPLNIPDLKYEEFLAFYKEKYKPSNSLIIIYGSLTDEEECEILNLVASYLDTFDTDSSDTGPLPVVKKASDFDKRKFILEAYQADSDEGNYTNLIYRLNNSFEGKVMQLMQRYFILDSRECYKEIMNTGLVERLVSYGVESSYLQPFFRMTFKLHNNEGSEMIRSIFEKHVSNAIVNGFDYEYINSLLTKEKMKLIENLDIKGINLINDFAKQFGMDQEFINIDLIEKFNQLSSFILNKVKLNEFLTNSILNNQNSLICEFYRDEEFNANRELIEKQRLMQVQQTLTQEQLNEIKLNTERIRLGIIDESNSVIPPMKLNDFINTNKNIDVPNLIVTENSQYTVLHSQGLTKKIANLSLIFKAGPNFDKHDIHLINLVVTNFFDFATEKYSALELEKVLKNNLSDYSTTCNYYSRNDEIESCFHFSFLIENVNTVNNLILDLFGPRDFNQIELITNLVNDYIGQLEHSLENESDDLITEKLYQQVTGSDYYDYFSYENYLSFFKDFKKELETNPEGFINKLEAVFHNFLQNLELCLTYIGPSSLPSEVITIANNISDKLNTNKYQPNFDLKAKKFESSLIEYQSKETVNYHNQVIDVENLDHFPGYFYLLSKICTDEFLYKEVRSKGGAYGTNMYYTNKAHLIWGSTYRDPKGVENLNFLQDALQFASNLNLDDSTFESYKIVTIDNYAPYQNSVNLYYTLINIYFGTSHDSETRNEIVNQITSCTQEDIKQIAKSILLKSQILKAVSYKIDS